MSELQIVRQISIYYTNKDAFNAYDLTDLVIEGADPRDFVRIDGGGATYGRTKPLYKYKALTQKLHFLRTAAQYDIRVSMPRASAYPPRLNPNGGVHRDGVIVDVDCAGSDEIIRLASKARAFNLRFSWVLVDNSASNSTKLEAIMHGVDVLPDSDVIYITANRLYEFYRVKPEEPLAILEHNLPSTTTRQEMALYWGQRPTTVTLRKNLGNISIVTTTQISFPQHFTGWNDLFSKQIDTFPKFTYPLIWVLAEDLNFRPNLKQVDLYGNLVNGSFNGLAGQLERHETELGATSMFMRTDRLRVVHFTAETLKLKTAFLFRQPAQSAVSNIFLLPFSRGVWVAIAVVFCLAGLFVATLSPKTSWMDETLSAITPGEAVTFTVGTICQQGFHMTPNLVSMRIAMLFTLVTSVFAFTSYSAKIVAILQTPSDAIQTIADLAKSPIACGVQETTYKKTYFSESTEPAVVALHKHKLLPFGDKAYLSEVDGIERMRTQFFAFQVEQPAAYDLISKTFTEHEKCMLTEIEAYQLPMVAIPLRKYSGFQDLVATRVRWQREVGIMKRFATQWFTPKPRCEQDSGGFVEVGLGDCLPAVQVLGCGMLVSVVVLVVEIVTDQIFRKKRSNI